MNLQHPILTVMVALNCEAKPWIDFYGLKKVIEKPFSLYEKQGANIQIVITGIGALAVSTAVGWVAGVTSANERVWLNIGIAGHLDRPIGEIVRVNSYIDASDLRRHYSPLTAKWGGDSDALMSVNAPSDNYPDQAMVDMEGVAFYKSAGMFSSTELIESIKVISDNQGNSVEGLNAGKITQLMHAHVAIVNTFADALLSLAKTSTASHIKLAVSDIRMTHSQRQQLKKLLHKASVLELHESVSRLNLDRFGNVNDILDQLHKLIGMTAPSIGCDSSAGEG